jgi:anthranilate/para-aminobenzoate synthase component II
MGLQWLIYAYDHKYKKQLKINHNGVVIITYQGNEVYLGDDISFAVTLYNKIQTNETLNSIFATNKVKQNKGDK